MIPLFEQYPLLRERLSYISLGEFPTPVQKLERLGMELGRTHLWRREAARHVPCNPRAEDYRQK